MNLEETKVSVLLPVYNNGKYLKYCLNGIIDFAYEIIIIEGCWNPEFPNRSNDSTLSVIDTFAAKYSNKIKVIYYDSSPDLKGPLTNTYKPIVLWNELRAKQSALDLVSGNWFMLVDSDEVYDPGQLVNLKSYLDNYTNIEDIAFSFSVPAFVFYFNYSFGTEEYFHRINSIRDKPLLTYTDNLDYSGLEYVHDYLDKDLVYCCHFGWTLDRLESKFLIWQAPEIETWKKKWELEISGQEPNLNNNYHLFAGRTGFARTFKKFDKKFPEILKALITG